MCDGSVIFVYQARFCSISLIVLVSLPLSFSLSTKINNIATTIEVSIYSIPPNLSPHTNYNFVTMTLVEHIQQVLPFVGSAKDRSKLTVQHPIAPLTAAEITESSKFIRESWPANTSLQFKVVTLDEPSKTELVPYLAAERAGGKLPTIARKSMVVYYIRNTVSIISSEGDGKEAMQNGMLANYCSGRTNSMRRL